MNYKQEKRIKDAAHMVRNVKSMSENMLQINSNYASDLEQFIQKIYQLQGLRPLLLIQRPAKILMK